MLVLSRKESERIVILLGTEEVEVKVLNVSGTRVKLGIEAPPEVRVVRKEVLLRQNQDG